MTARAGARRADVYKLLLLIGLLAAVITAFNALYVVPPRGNRFDVYPRWAGSRMIWRSESPYTPAATEAIQAGMFGGVLPASVDQQRMVYPAYVALLLAPLLPLPPATAIALWLTVQLLAVLITPIIWLQILDWKPQPALLGLLIVGLVLVFRYPINLYLVGQFTGTILLGFSLAVALLQRRRDAAAGLVLALAAVPPTIAVPLALLLLVGCAVQGRWRGLLAFGAALLVMTLITFVQIGWWLPDFIAQLGSYASYAAPVWAPGLIEPPLLRWLFVGAVGLLLLWALERFRRSGAVVDFVTPALAACLLLLPQTGNYYLVLLIPPLLLLFRRGGTAVRIGAALAIVSPWLFRALPASTPEALLLPLYVLGLWGGAALLAARATIRR